MENNNQNLDLIKNNQFSLKIVIVLISAILTAAVLVGGGVYYWQKSVFEEEKIELEDKIEVLEEKVEELGGVVEEDDPYKDWKVYRNEEYGFEMKYPNEIKVSEEDVTTTYASFVVDKWEKITDKINKTIVFEFQPCVELQLTNPATACKLKINTLVTQESLDSFIMVDNNLDEFFLGDYGAPSYANIEISNIGGINEVYKVIIPGMGRHELYYVKSGNLLVRVEDGFFFFLKETNVKDDVLSNQILSTFKFID